MGGIGGSDIGPVRTRAVVLVEGNSDRIAVETLADRLGRNLEREGVSVVSIGGVHAMGRFLAQFGPHGANTTLAGLYDVAEEHVVSRGLQRAGLLPESQPTRLDVERLGFYACDADLEDELIRALGAASVQSVLDREDDLTSFRTLQKEPAWRGRPVETQLRRFMGSGGRRKLRYARLLVEALDLADVPRPLQGVLAQV